VPVARAFWAQYAWLPGGLAERVLIGTAGDRIAEVRPGTDPPAGADRLAGLTLPGLANAHSHAFHRALRARTQAGRGSFWTWRERMYAVAERLDPDRYRALARAVYAEMALAGITCVGEFHYLHHAPGGARYRDPNAMGRALLAGAAEAGIRITLVDACYLAGGIGQPLAGVQARFGDGDADRWAARAGELAARLPEAYARMGAAVHSVRAVPREQMPTVAAWAASAGVPLHAHLAEQRAEVRACRDAYGATPAAVLAAAGGLGRHTTVVHATHLTGDDIRLIGAAGGYTCMCPTTERDLADGIGPATRLRDAGSAIILGSDSQAVIDLFEEARAVELDERLRTRTRGHWRAGDLLVAATEAGHASLGWPQAGRLAAGALADLTTLALDTPRLAGFAPETAAESAVFAACAGDVRQVVVGGEVVVRGGVHLRVEDVPGALHRAILDLD
jgi:formiminoglutamate deiminase